MTRNAPGHDRVENLPVETVETGSPARGSARYSPPRGAGGVFAEFLQGATPKYSRNAGPRRDTQHRNTLARIMVRVDRDEYQTFLQSIGDEHVRTQLADRIAGDPTNPRRRGDPSAAGYVDFLLTDIQMPFQEKVQISETLADNYVAYFFGQSAPVFQFNGFLINTVQDDQATNFFRLYESVLRGTQLARRQKIMSMRFDSYIVAGAMVNLNLGLNSSREILVPFSFQVLAKKLLIVNYTVGWVPTRVDGPFAADPLLVPYDGRPRQLLNLREITVTAPTGLEEGPEDDAPIQHQSTGPAASGAPEASFAPPTPAETVVSRHPEVVTPASRPANPNVRPRGGVPASSDTRTRDFVAPSTAVSNSELFR